MQVLNDEICHTIFDTVSPNLDAIHQLTDKMGQEQLADEIQCAAVRAVIDAINAAFVLGWESRSDPSWLLMDVVAGEDKADEILNQIDLG